jgi:uncharacterized protein (UPF0548 family)
MLILAPCRVVRATDEPEPVRIRLGPLPGHPGSGEEAFHVVLETDGTVTAVTVAFSRPLEEVRIGSGEKMSGLSKNAQLVT